MPNNSCHRDHHENPNLLLIWMEIILWTIFTIQFFNMHIISCVLCFSTPIYKYYETNETCESWTQGGSEGPKFLGTRCSQNQLCRIPIQIWFLKGLFLLLRLRSFCVVDSLFDSFSIDNFLSCIFMYSYSLHFWSLKRIQTFLPSPIFTSHPKTKVKKIKHSRE